MRFVSLLLLALVAINAPAAAQTFGGRVVRVVDGDTFDLLTLDKNRLRIRLAESDAPELKQSYGREARALLATIILRQAVSFRLVKVDKYGRLVGHVSVGSGRAATDVSAVMVQRGAAWAYLDYLTDQRFLIWENAARAQRLGLWALPAAQQVPPWEERNAARRSRYPVKAAIARQSGTAVLQCGQKRLCKQMVSCAEATFHLQQCGLKALDANHDGRPCEALCKVGR